MARNKDKKRPVARIRFAGRLGNSGARKSASPVGPRANTINSMLTRQQYLEASPSVTALGMPVAAR